MSVAASRRALNIDDLRHQLSTASFLRTIEITQDTGSTNADLMNRATQGADVSGTVLLAEHQTAGRGRNGRRWSSVPYAQITMSVGVPTSGLPTSSWGWVPLAAGLAVVDAIHACTGMRFGLKWPNDVLVPADGRKLAGILAEVAVPSKTIIVGIGLNVSLSSSDLPDLNAASLAILGASNLDRTEIAGAILRELERRMRCLTETGGPDASLMADYTNASLTVGSRVRAILPGNRDLTGDALAVDEQGRLLVDTGVDITEVSAGDIVHLRSA